jgi:hypothetical protein
VTLCNLWRCRKDLVDMPSFHLQFKILKMYTADSFVTLASVYKRHGFTSRRLTVRLDNCEWCLSKGFWVLSRGIWMYFCDTILERKSALPRFDSIQILLRIWRSCYRASLIYSFKYNQQDATLYNILYCCQCSTCFRRVFRPSSGAQTVHTASGICPACLLLLLAWVSWQFTHASGSSKQTWHITDAVYSFSSRWWAEKPPETCRASAAVKNIV